MFIVSSASRPDARPHSLSPVFYSSALPSFLKIRFTDASDLETVANLFMGNRKRELDPHNKVRRRSYAELKTPVSEGSAVVAFDEGNDIRFFGMASDHIRYTGNLSAITEIGGIMSDVKGCRLTQIASAMLALQESVRLREQYPCLTSHGIHALVAKDNIGAKKVFGRDLGWEDITCGSRSDTLFNAQGKYDCPDQRAARIWYAFQDKALVSARDMVSKLLTKHSLTSRDGHTIPVDLDTRVYDII
ncbi:MAG: hypothetical protein ACPGRX_07960 [Bdellovibrionales bacterium]